jgi:polyferredoxin
MLADIVLSVHAAFVIFVVGALPATWIGAAARRPWAFNPWFRGAHLAAITFVAAESLLGYLCPLTMWEDALRGRSDDRGFIARFIHAWLYWDWPPAVFTAIYVTFGLLVVWTWVRFPPRRTRR